MQKPLPEQATLTELVIACLSDILAESEQGASSDLTEETVLIGRGAVLNSLGLVTLIVDLEQRIEEEYEIALTLADDRAMSQKSSPFRTVGTFASYITRLIAEEQADG